MGINSFTTKFKGHLSDPLATFRVYEFIIAIVCICIPAILRIFDKDSYYPGRVCVLTMERFKNPGLRNTDSLHVIPKDILGFRGSISDYVYSSNSYLFGMLLCIGGMLFIFNSAVYFKNEYTLQLNSKGKWYNAILGIALLGVICTPHRDYTVWHYFFAGIFFIGNAVVIGLFHNKKDEIKSIVMAVLCIALLTLSFFIQGITRLWGEWLSLIVIAIHLMMETKLKQNHSDLAK